MNCDQAFDAMTGPDRPPGRALAQHLMTCPRCRQMYETLEPALSLFGAVDGDVPEELPTTSARQTSVPAQMAHRIATRLSPAGAPSASEPPRHRLWGAVFAAAAAGFLLNVGLGSFAPGPPTESMDPVGRCTWVDRKAVRDGEGAQAVVVACAACHLTESRNQAQRRVSLQDSSCALDQQILASRAVVVPSRAADNVLVAFNKRRGRSHV